MGWAVARDSRLFDAQCQHRVDTAARRAGKRAPQQLRTHRVKRHYARWGGFLSAGLVDACGTGLAVLHSRDLVNWDFESYALDKLDPGPEFRLEGGKHVYGLGIWGTQLSLSRRDVLHFYQRERQNEPDWTRRRAIRLTVKKEKPR
jgi:hypothetical protein